MELQQATAGTTDDPLESSALAMTLIALASALWVTAYTSAGSVVGIAASKMSMASCICRPCALDALHRERSARVRISGRTASASVVTVQILCQSLTARVLPIPDGSHTDSLARAVHRLGDVVPLDSHAVFAVRAGHALTAAPLEASTLRSPRGPHLAA